MEKNRALGIVMRAALVVVIIAVAGYIVTSTQGDGIEGVWNPVSMYEATYDGEPEVVDLSTGELMPIKVSGLDGYTVDVFMDGVWYKALMGVDSFSMAYGDYIIDGVQDGNRLTLSTIKSDGAVVQVTYARSGMSVEDDYDPFEMSVGDMYGAVDINATIGGTPIAGLSTEGRSLTVDHKESGFLFYTVATPDAVDGFKFVVVPAGNGFLKGAAIMDDGSILKDDIYCSGSMASLSSYTFTDDGALQVYSMQFAKHGSEAIEYPDFTDRVMSGVCEMYVEGAHTSFDVTLTTISQYGGIVNLTSTSGDDRAGLWVLTVTPTVDGIVYVKAFTVTTDGDATYIGSSTGIMNDDSEYALFMCRDTATDGSREVLSMVIVNGN